MILKITPLFAFIIGALALDIHTETTEKLILDRVTNPNQYDKRFPPSNYNSTGPLEVQVNLYLKSVNFIDDTKEVFQIDVTYRQSWIDRRLKYDSRNDTIGSLTFNTDLIWVPDIFFTNEHKGYFHEIMQPNILLKVLPNGEVLYSRRITTTLRCPMDFSYFPFDTQTCTWQMESYSKQADRLMLKWKEDNPLQLSKTLQLQLYSLEDVKTSANLFMSGKYSCLKATFQFKRLLNYYVTHIFMPCIMLVLVSWTVFWINKNKITARVLISTGTLFTLSMFTWNINNDLPKVSYIKQSDVFTGISLAFVFATLLETCTVHYLSPDKEKSTDDESCKGTGDKDAILGRPKKCTLVRKVILFNYRHSHKLDIISRFLFPSAYILFNTLYWCINV